MSDYVTSGLAEEEADVKEGGRSDCEASPAVPDNVPLVWTQAVAAVLWKRQGENNTHHMSDCTTVYSTEAMTQFNHTEQTIVMAQDTSHGD